VGPLWHRSFLCKRFLKSALVSFAKKDKTAQAPLGRLQHTTHTRMRRPPSVGCASARCLSPFLFLAHSRSRFLVCSCSLSHFLSLSFSLSNTRTYTFPLSHHLSLSVSCPLALLCNPSRVSHFLSLALVRVFSHTHTVSLSQVSPLILHLLSSLPLHPSLDLSLSLLSSLPLHHSPPANPNPDGPNSLP